MFGNTSENHRNFNELMSNCCQVYWLQFSYFWPFFCENTAYLTLSLFMWVNWPTFQNHQNLRLLRSQLSIFMSKQRFRRSKSGYEVTSVNSGAYRFDHITKTIFWAIYQLFFVNLNISLWSTVDHLDDPQGVFWQKNDYKCNWVIKDHILDSFKAYYLQ